MADQISKGAAYTDAVLNGAVIDNSVIGATTKAAASVTALTATGVATLSGNLVTGTNASSTVGFYGTTPATQRTNSVQAASIVSAASFISVSTNLCLFAAEVAATLTGLGLWKGV